MTETKERQEQRKLLQQNLDMYKNIQQSSRYKEVSRKPRSPIVSQSVVHKVNPAYAAVDEQKKRREDELRSEEQSARTSKLLTAYRHAYKQPEAE